MNLLLKTMSETDLASGDTLHISNILKVDIASKLYDGHEINGQIERKDSKSKLELILKSNHLLTNVNKVCNTSYTSIPSNDDKRVEKLSSSEVSKHLVKTKTTDSPKILNYDLNDFLNVCTISKDLSANVASKLDFDENLLAYGEQLERYQHTLQLAQIEKRNAIRRHMALKAYQIKLIELENQCNVELLRVKQSLQYLEPLHLMVKSWSMEEPPNDFSLYDVVPVQNYVYSSRTLTELDTCSQYKLDLSSLSHISAGTTSSSNSSPYLL